jgi:hypothetical protein
MIRSLAPYPLFGRSRQAGQARRSGFRNIFRSCMLKFTPVSEIPCLMRLRTAGRFARCGSGRAIWIATIFYGENFVGRSKWTPGPKKIWQSSSRKVGFLVVHQREQISKDASAALSWPPGVAIARFNLALSRTLGKACIRKSQIHVVAACSFRRTDII